MDTFTTSSKNESGDVEILKGATYDLSPVNIFLAILIIILNTIIIVEYFKDRAKLTSLLFMGIAISDILTAQGQLVVSVTSILVNNGLAEENVLYKSLYYYMSTALPGFSCSKYFNLVMSITLTVHIVDPFRRLHTTCLKRLSLAVMMTVTFLHISDTVATVITDSKYQFSVVEPLFYIRLLGSFQVPGLITSAIMYCVGAKVETNVCLTHSQKYRTPKTLNLAAAAYIIIYGAFPCVILVCMVVQVVYLRKRHALFSVEKRRASNTIMLNSVLFFVCHATYMLIMAVWMTCVNRTNASNAPSLFVQGLVIGLAEFTLPLIYAAACPIILIRRKEEIRQKHIERLSRIFSSFRRDDVGTEED